MISLGQARAHVVLKQGLAGPGLDSVAGATRAAGCVYATAPTCYLGYAARTHGLVVADLDRELYETRSHVRLRAMRGSSYIVPVELLPAVVGATEEVTVGALDRILRYAGVDPELYATVSVRIEEVMRGRGPLTKAAIKGEIGPVAAGRADALNYVIAVMARECRVVRATVRGGWRSDSYLYALWDEWVPEPLERLPFDRAAEELARLYLGAYGPATAEDLAWWAGWKLGAARDAVQRLGDEVEPVDVEGTPMVIAAGELDALRAAGPEAAAGARLLPVWDSYLMGFKDRRRLVSDEQRPLVYDKAGNGTSVLLLDGVVAGVWEMDVDDKGIGLTIRVAPFGPTRRWREIEAAAERIGTSVAATSIEVERADHVPRPLVESGARNAFLAPIRLGAP